MKCPNCDVKIPIELMRQKKTLSYFHCRKCHYQVSSYKGMDKVETHIKGKEAEKKKLKAKLARAKRKSENGVDGG